MNNNDLSIMSLFYIQIFDGTVLLETLCGTIQPTLFTATSNRLVISVKTAGYLSLYFGHTSLSAVYLLRGKYNV